MPAKNKPARMITMFDFFMEQADWNSYDKDRREMLELVLSVLLSCVENDQVNAEKLARLATVISGGKLNFKL